ncbi:hypothetical protein LCGC14_0764250 [marine sediment metagenome]|uniref:Uncharacterized protein n=1 Tax=marine sediment metagenome TaxID=412755 RepID=A0A0F9QK22_9ZZZZ
MAFESDNCIDVFFISSGVGGLPGYLEIIKKKYNGPYSMIECGDPNQIMTIPLGSHVAGHITKEKFDKVDKSKANIVIGRSLIFNSAYRTYIDLMAHR